jgi:translation initiation factor SUI1
MPEPDRHPEGTVHLRYIQRKARKTVTIIQGPPLKHIERQLLKALRKRLCCNCAIIESDDGKAIALQGDQRAQVKEFLISTGVVSGNGRIIAAGL